MMKPIRIHKPVLCFIASLWLLVACSPSLATITPTPSLDPTLAAMVIMTGTLHKPDLAAVVGSTIMLAASDAQGSGVVISGDGTPINPEGKIAADGKFTIAISHEFLDSVHYKVKLVLVYGPYPTDLLDQNGNPMVVTLSRTIKALDLGVVPAQ